MRFTGPNPVWVIGSPLTVMAASIIKVCDKRPFKRALGRQSYICGSGLIGRQERAHLWTRGREGTGEAAQEG